MFMFRKIDSQKIRYLLAGGWNTLFGYGCGLALYYGIEGHIHIILIGVAANILAISMAFLTYKIFVFKTKGNWLKEYFRAYIVYGATAVIGIFLLWFLVDAVGSPFWLSQGLSIVIMVIVSFISHSRFTFKTRT